MRPTFSAPSRLPLVISEIFACGWRRRINSAISKNWGWSIGSPSPCNSTMPHVRDRPQNLREAVQRHVLLRHVPAGAEPAGEITPRRRLDLQERDIER
jgi:hypothetical protein